MKRLLIQLLLATLSANLALGQDLQTMLKFDKITSDVVANNPYFDDFSTEVCDSGDSVTVKFPVKKDLPETMRLKGNIEYNGVLVAAFDVTICEALDNEEFAMDITKYGTPKEKFDKKCPVLASTDYAINKYKYPTEKIAPGTPDGKGTADVYLYEPGKDPYASLHVEGTLTSKLPQLPGLGR